MADLLAAFNQLYKEIDEIYHQYAKSCSISDTALWIIYSVCENDTSYTQRELCSDWHYPPQTINSALKSLEKQGLIVLEPVCGNQKNKWLVLTEKGKKVAQEVISPLVLAEQKAFQRLGEQERSVLLSLTRKYVEFLRTEVGRL